MIGTKYTMAQASRIAEKGRSTLDRHIKAGKLSVDKNADGIKVIDASELIRAYGNDLNFDLADVKKNQTQRSEAKQSSEIARLQELNGRLIAQYKAQVKTLEEALDKAQDGQNRVTLLLERQTKDGPELEAKLNAMAEKHNREIQMLKKALHAERNKTFWQRLVG